MSLGYKDPRWQQKRLQQFNAADWQCCECGSKSSELNLHHYWYERGRELWEYPDECFAVLCDSCHTEWHRKKLNLDRSLQFSLSQMDQACGLIWGLNCIMNGVDIHIHEHMDGMTVAAIIRGFWAPYEYQRPLINYCLERIANNKFLMLSEAVYVVVPLNDPKFAFLAGWHKSATRWRNG